MARITINNIVDVNSRRRAPVVRNDTRGRPRAKAPIARFTDQVFVGKVVVDECISQPDCDNPPTPPECDICPEFGRFVRRMRYIPSKELLSAGQCWGEGDIVNERVQNPTCAPIAGGLYVIVIKIEGIG